MMRYERVDQIIMKRPVNYVIEADIKGFFDNVSHDWLLKMLEVRIKDPSFLLLIRRFLESGVCGRRPMGQNLSRGLHKVET